MNQSNEKLQPLERLLALANRKQELGFVVLGKVIDRATLKTVFLSIFAGLCTIIPIILVLSSQQTLASGSSACDLSASQVAKIKGAMLGANASCSFNQTINDVRLKTDDGLSSQHELVFAVRQAGVRELSARVQALDAERPPHISSLSELKTFTEDTAATAGVKRWLDTHVLGDAGGRIVRASPNGEYLRVAAPVAKWEELFGGGTSIFKAFKRHQTTALRCTGCSLEAQPALRRHVSAVFLLSTLPPPRAFSRRLLRVSLPPPAPAPLPVHIDPAKLAAIYRLQISSSGEGQGVFGETAFDPSSLAIFAQRFLANSSSAAVRVVKNSNTSLPDWRAACTGASSGQCGEADLDLEYLRAVARAPTDFFYVSPTDEEPMVSFLELLASLKAPPSVLSISWDNAEELTDANLIDAFNTEALKLSARGVSLIAASGDDGVMIPPARQNQSYHGLAACGYHPTWPASSPYVTAVGATQGHEKDGLPVVACQSAKGGGITSGGGFATKSARLPLQDHAVHTYLAGAGSKSATGFDASGAAYPDVSVAGAHFVIVAGNETSVGSGTSVSAPIFAGMISVINARRKSKGLQSAGFLNPTLYSSDSRAAFRDIVSGENNCAAGHNVSALVCCGVGFTAAAGWDPLTGVGEVISLDKLAAAFGAGKARTPLKLDDAWPADGADIPTLQAGLGRVLTNSAGKRNAFSLFLVVLRFTFFPNLATDPWVMAAAYEMDGTADLLIISRLVMAVGISSLACQRTACSCARGWLLDAVDQCWGNDQH